MFFTKNILLNTLSQYFNKAISLVISIFVTSILTRKLGVSGYGQYVYVFALVYFINTLADWGSAFVAIREASKNQDKQGSIYFTTLVLRLSISLIAQLLLIVYSLFFINSNLSIPIIVASFVLPALSLKTSLQVIFQSRFQIWKLGLIDTLSSAVFLLLILFFSRYSSFTVLIYLYLCLSAFASVIAGFILSFRLVKFKLEFDFKYARFLISQSLSMGLLLVLYSVYNRIDVFMLKAFKGDEAVGIYGFSYKIYEFSILGAGLFADATFPLLSLRSTNKVLFKQAFEKYIAILIVLGLFVSVGLYLFTPLIINVLTGNKFIEAIVPLRLLSVFIFVAYLGHATGYSLISLNKQTVSLVISFAALLVNIFLNYLLIPLYSYNASAVITGITEVLVFVSGLVVMLRYLGGLNLKSGFSSLSPRHLLQIIKPDIINR